VLNIAIMICYLVWSSKRVSHLICTHCILISSIINKIQASITGEAKVNLGEYEENAIGKQNDTNIQDRT
jgi:hypothetical protein